MEGLIDNTKKFMETDQGKNMQQQFDQQDAANSGAAPSGDPQTADPTTQPPSYSAQGEKGQPGQYGQEGQYGAVRGQGFGGGLAKGVEGGKKDKKDKVIEQGVPAKEREHRSSAYEGYEGDSTPSGGWGKNAQGDSFARANQMGADGGAGTAPPAQVFAEDEDEGYGTGTSTPAYRQEGDVDAEAAENRQKNQNMNVYGQQADDSGAKGNDYNEAI